MFLPCRLALPVVMVVLCVSRLWGGEPFEIHMSSFLGGSGDEDAVVGVRIQGDGTIVVAANLAGDFQPPVQPKKTSGPVGHHGLLLRLGSDGRQVLGLHRIAAEVKDLALDGQDNIYVAAGKAGAIKLSAQADAVLWTQDLGDSCERIDAAADGHCVALVAGKQIAVLDPADKPLATVTGKAFTTDVCIDGASRTVIFTGFRNARAHDGKRNEPVQISYVKGVGYDGQEKWSNYDWSTDQASDRFINRSTNNMADTRGYRCQLGRDGKLYAAFESAGGNHIFRWMPNNIMEKAPIVGGGPYHEFWGGGGAVHRTVFGRFDPATGKVELLQQFTGRTEKNACTNVRMKQGVIAGDEDGRAFLAGWAGASLPLDLDPVPDQPRGGPFLLGMSSDFRARLVCTRMHGQGSVHAADVRRIGQQTVVVYGGSGAEEGLFLENALQATPRGKDGFLVILRGK